MAGKVHDVGAVIVESVRQITECRCRCVLNGDEVAVFRATQALPHLSNFLVHTKPGPVPDRCPVGCGDGSGGGIRIGGQVEDTESFGDRWNNIHVADLSRRSARLRNSASVIQLVSSPSRLVPPLGALRSSTLGRFRSAKRGRLCGHGLVSSGEVLSRLGHLALRSVGLPVLALCRGLQRAGRRGALGTLRAISLLPRRFARCARCFSLGRDGLRSTCFLVLQRGYLPSRCVAARHLCPNSTT